MKKTIALFLILMMLLACFVSCSNDDKIPSVNENNNEQSKPVEDIFLYSPSTTYESKLTPEFEYAFDYGVEAGSVFSDHVVVDELVGKEIIPFNDGKIFVYKRTKF